MSLDFAVGLGKTIFNSSVAIIPCHSLVEAQIVLSERFNRNKNSGAWPETPLRAILPVLENSTLEIAENRDVQSTQEFETYYDSRFPFLDRIAAYNLERFSSLKSNITQLNHHEAHAYSALAFAPFEECLILVLDGAGSSKLTTDSSKSYEYLSLYKWKNYKLEVLDKKYLTFTSGIIKGHSFCEGIGLFYEKASEYIFNNKSEAGKVMGLAPFGKSAGVQNSFSKYLEALDWSKQYHGLNKNEWENSPHMEIYKDLAATVQENFEHFLFSYLDSIKSYYSEQTQFIFTGGCAMNCTFNGKLAEKKVFKSIYIPPNPGDEGISLGCAFKIYLNHHPERWKAVAFNSLTSYLGLKSSVPSSNQIKEVFMDYYVSAPADLVSALAQRLNDGEIIALFQGRSEVGPRALGNRSILASPNRKNLKEDLNKNVKFREDFRPYGCTVKWDRAHDFFEVTRGFENPFMSFAVKVKSEYKNILKDLSHIDGTSRMQTLHKEQNPFFYDLLEKMEELNGCPILLNTSLNVMNEPIVETVQDARRFFEASTLSTMVVGSYLITKNKRS